LIIIYSNIYKLCPKEHFHKLLGDSTPLKEPDSWGGPIVMNTKEELDEAFNKRNNNTWHHELNLRIDGLGIIMHKGSL